MKYVVLLYEGLLTMTIYLPLLHGPGIYSNHDGLLTIFVMASHFILPITQLHFISIHIGNN